MKLLSLYIDSFGKISDYSYDFNSKVNNIYQENGWGKTTLSMFIKAMLYGLSNKSEREKYTPWKNISNFGGSLVIEAKNREYRIVRTFNPKKASLDTLEIYDLRNGLLVNDINSVIGEYFLNLSESSFERSVFIPQKDIDEGFGSDIEAKLANLIGGTNDSQTYDEALNILKDKSKELYMNSKKGLILDLKNELEQVSLELDDCQNKIDSISTIEANIEKTNEQLDDLLIQKQEVNKKIINYTRDQEKKIKLAIADKYTEDIKNTKLLIEQNNAIFNGHVVDVDTVLQIRGKYKEMTTLKNQFEFKKNQSRATTKINEVTTKIDFSDGTPTDEEIKKVEQAIEKHQEIKSIIKASEIQVVQKKPINGIVMTILSSLMLTIGVLMIVLAFALPDANKVSFLVPGISMSAVSILGYALSIGFFVANQNKTDDSLGGHVKNYDYELRQLDELIREFFGKYHLYTSDFRNNMFIIKSNLDKYKDAVAEYNELNSETFKLSKRIEALESEVLTFLSKFSTTAYNVEEKIGELNTHLRKKTELENQLVVKETNLKQYIMLNDLQNLDFEELDIDGLNLQAKQLEDKIAELNNNKTTYSNKIVEYESEISKIDELESKQSLLSNQIREKEEELRLVNLSMEYLTKSQNLLLEKYVAPMKESVTKYVSLLLKDKEYNSEYNIDINFKFQFITASGLKSLEMFSRGYQAIISLCMRLALIDCLYPDEKPFVIFDDPFINLDDEKLDICKNLMKNIANSYQLVYFTCHESRKIN